MGPDRSNKVFLFQRMYGEGWVWIATDGGASLYMGSDLDVNITTAGFVGIAPESMSSTYRIVLCFE